MVNQKCIITIIGKEEEEDTISMKVEWIPSLNTKDESKNHRAVVEAGIRAIDSIGRDSSEGGGE